MSSAIDKKKEEILPGALKKIREFNRPIVLQLDVAAAIDLIGMVQLALRHPDAKKLGAAQRTEKLIADLIEKIDPHHGDLWKLLNLGFHTSMNKDLGLAQASLYLATRARARTPLGAAEYLDYHSTRERESFDNRLKIAIGCMNIYRHAFPEEYRRSTAPFFSIQREHELYRLVNSKLFPLLYGDGFELEATIERHPQFFLPIIPVRGLQRYNWIPGCVDLAKVGPAFQLALAMREFPGAWEFMVQNYPLADCPKPERPLAAVGSALFSYSCAVEESPLQWLPFVFEMTSYNTGNVWLDLPPTGTVGMEWSLAEVVKLHFMKADAADRSLLVTALAGYLAEDPSSRIKRAVEIWNAAALKEQQSGFQGMCIDEDTGAWHTHEHE